MNRIHRLVFNHTLGLVQVASERVRRHSRRAGGASVPCLSPLAAGLALALASAGPVAAQELIDGTHEIVDGYDPGGSGSGTRPSPWVIDGELGIAHGGIAGLTIRNGGSVSADAVLLGIEATGSGSLTLSGSGSLRGILETGYLEKGAGSATITFNGGVLRAGSSQQDFLRNFGAGDVIIGSNGAFIDSNGHAIGIGSSLEGSGRLNKIGEGTLTLTGSGSSTGGIRIEQGALAVAGGGTVSSTADIVAGYAADADGTVLVSGRDSVLESTGRLAAVRIGREGQGQLRIEDGGQVRSTYLMVVGDRETGSGTVSVTGAGSLLETTSDAPSFIGDSGQGRLEIGAGGHVRSMYFASVGYRESGVGVAHVSGEGSVWSVRSESEPGGNMYVGDAGDGTLVLADGGHLDLGDTPFSHVTLARETGSSGLLVLGAQPGQPAAAAGTINARSIHFGHGDATLVFNHAGEEYVLDLELRSEPSSAAGAGEDRIEHLAGFTRLTGRGTRFTGTTAVIGGTLAVDDRLGGTVQVLDGGTLAGSGTVGATTVHDGGTLAPGGSIGTLTVNGDLTLSSGARLGFGLGSPGPADDPAAGRSDTVNVAGDLVLDGTLDLHAAGDPEDSPGVGYYRLITYGGALQDNGLEIGQLPGPDDPARYRLQAGNQRVDLYVAALGADTLQHWQGGDGVWSAGNAQWLNQDGEVPVAWAGNHAVFRYQPGDFAGGTITVEGEQSFRGLQFVDDGYVLDGDGQLRTHADGSEVRVLEGVRAQIAAGLAGDGGLAKTGGGTLIYTGDGSRMAGVTQVAAGTLAVHGQLGGRLEVLQGATLAGTGRIGRLDLHGQLDLGGPGGHMDVQDDAVFHAGSIWNLHADAAGQAGRLAVAGRASIDPESTLAVLADGRGSWAPRTTYTILDAGDGVDGGFGTVTSNLAFLAPSLVYGPDQVTLVLDRNDVRFGDRALTRNQRAAAAGAESLDFGHAVYGAVVTLADDDAGLAAAFDALSGEAHASGRALLLEDARAMDGAIARRLDGEVAMEQLRPGGTLVWLDGNGSQFRLGGDGNAARATASGEGLVLGADMAAGERTRIGAAAGTRRILQRVNDRAARTEGDGRQLALYAGTQWGRVALRGGVARTAYDLDLGRTVGFGALDQRLEARQEATATTWFAEAALAGSGGPLPRPWLALGHTRLASDASSESGGSAALSVAGGRHELGTATLGLRGAWDVSGGGRSMATVHADLGWRHAWGDLTPDAVVAFADGDAFTVHAPAMHRNAAVYRLGLGLSPTPRSRLAIGLDGLAGDGARAIAGHLQWQLSF